MIYQATKLFWTDCLTSSLCIRFKRKRKREETIHRPPDDVQRSKEASDEASGACLSSDDCRMEPGADQCTGKSL